MAQANGHTMWSDQLFAARFEQHPRIEAKNVTRKRIRKSAAGQILSLPPRMFGGYPITPPGERYLAWLGVRFRTAKDTYDPNGQNGW